ncbi:VOC family protein [Rhodococcus fascians]|nr:VOC family protein [Rhodococcus fascians]MBY3995186.1 VOC family protein [Rhodococcus fascians]MBY4000494.1 VOC family protein [Rhodococcus fascians]MBY4005522.1 VOC family protein [Rhodococcus fascians]MBY4016355.1 VOC family protein [Rhodococcus fascians]
MNVTQLAYLVIGSDDLPAWRTFATRNLGAMVSGDDSTALRIRLDELEHRILVVPTAANGLLASGWATRDSEAYLAAMQVATDAGVAIEAGSDADCRVRGVEAYFTFADPSGNVHEVCWGRTQVAEPFSSPAGISSFVTGELGLGHVALPGPENYDESLAFYRDVFGFAPSDFFRLPDEGGRGPRVTFLHPRNARQHSLAFGEIENPYGCLHFMVEVRTLDEVGRMMDRATQDGLLRRTLGRHVNDEMVSFYIESPSGLLVEFGYDGMQMEWDGHDVRQIPRGSYWGHTWL